MKKSVVLLLVLSLFSVLNTACFYKPHPHGCPPGQEKKGNC